ncbi:hypothetical protein [Algoriphagus boritolerans]|uniref:Uncharacterized protein n=1 Tax=Algoriphagus boritolerans DSM 17298 = JCM 18970 TaxID=1120964 RepID=A0A1H5ZWY9_9BACT|nr:hypothetical protein [Algoriphagus boritolerans]SEG40285.1 hypothetical protein SAMN03080598_03761 [Algoriphagus boritolerans DSM 17298 = JCM 18970]
MKQITPYTSYHEAIEAFDNGGKFFNLFCHAHDGVVSPAELGKVAEVADDKQSMILYLVMSISRLDNRSRERILARLDAQLFDIYEKYRPVHMSLDQMLERGKAGMSTTLVGTVKKISNSSAFSGSIMVPVVIDEVTTFTMVPIEDSYEVYELRSEHSKNVALVAHHKEKEGLPERKLRVGGMINSLSEGEAANQPNTVFLEVQFYMEED